MAERRMFSNTIIDSDCFLDMPQTSKVLYFYLCMNADDDGFISSPKKIMRCVNSKNSDLKILIDKNFVISFDSGVCVITHWKIHNHIRKDRHVSTIYNNEIDLLAEDETGAYILKKNNCLQDVNQMSTKRQPNDNQMSAQYSIDKDSIDKDSVDKDSVDKDSIIYTASDEAEKTNSTKKPKKHKYGEYQNVLLTDEELEKLKNKFSDWESKIENFSQGIEMKGYKYKNHYLAILKWAENEKKKTTGSEPDFTDMSRYQNNGWGDLNL